VVLYNHILCCSSYQYGYIHMTSIHTCTHTSQYLEKLGPHCFGFRRKQNVHMHVHATNNGLKPNETLTKTVSLQAPSYINGTTSFQKRILLGLLSWLAFYAQGNTGVKEKQYWERNMVLEYAKTRKHWEEREAHHTTYLGVFRQQCSREKIST
jgi:hypothetical protein